MKYIKRSEKIIQEENENIEYLKNKIKQENDTKELKKLADSLKYEIAIKEYHEKVIADRLQLLENLKTLTLIEEE